jgi:hypothetical protein
MSESIFNIIIITFSFIFMVVLALAMVPFVKGMADYVGVTASSVASKDLAALITFAAISPVDMNISHQFNTENHRLAYNLSANGRIVIVRRIPPQAKVDTFNSGIPIEMYFGNTSECGPVEKIIVSKSGDNVFVYDATNPSNIKLCV